MSGDRSVAETSWQGSVGEEARPLLQCLVCDSCDDPRIDFDFLDRNLEQLNFASSSFNHFYSLKRLFHLSVFI